MNFFTPFATYLNREVIEGLTPGHGPFGILVFFIAFFPVFLSVLWSVSVLYGVLIGRLRPRTGALHRERLPTFSILVPFCGDGRAVARTVASLQHITPAPERIILIDDGSPTGNGITHCPSFAAHRVKFLRLPQNVGKAEALNRALRDVRSEVAVCLDSDTLASTRDWSGMLGQFAIDRSLGAITGKIWPTAIRNIVELLQAIDYLAVICLVKSAETMWGGLTTVSGAWVAYRRSALEECGGWNAKTSAEDIDVSWRLQSRGWRIGYDAKWTARVQMATSWKSLWRQRRRWSSGLGRTMREQLFDAFGRKARHLPVAVIAVMGAMWVWSVLALCGAMMLGTLSHHALAFLAAYFMTGTHFHCSLYSEAFVVQLLVAISTDGGRWRQYPLMFLCAAFYPLYFWIILFTSFVAGFPRGFCQADGGQWRATGATESEVLA